MPVGCTLRKVGFCILIYLVPCKAHLLRTLLRRGFPSSKKMKGKFLESPSLLRRCCVGTQRDLQEGQMRLRTPEALIIKMQSGVSFHSHIYLMPFSFSFTTYPPCIHEPSSVEHGPGFSPTVGHAIPFGVRSVD